MGIFRLLLNVIWIVLCGWWMAILYALAGIICFILIITIPFGIAAFRISGFVLWPFGRQIDRRPDAGIASLIGNLIWIVLFGWWLAIGHLVGRHLTVPDGHRYPARPGQLQDHPDFALPARGAHRPGPHVLAGRPPRGDPAGEDRGTQLPVKTGLRRSRNEAMPSCWSFEPTSATLSRFSWSV